MDPITNFLNGFSLVGIPAVIIFPFLIQGLKKLGLPVQWTGVASLVLAGLLAAGIYSIQTWPQTEPWIKLVVFSILLALSAPGLYSQEKVVTARKGEGGK